MSTYSRQKFQSLTEARKAKVLLDTIYEIESVWEFSDLRFERISRFKNYFEWADLFKSEASMLKRVAPLLHNISHDMSLRTLLDIAVPLERFNEMSVKDFDMGTLKHGDRDKAVASTLPIFYILDHLRSAFNVGSLFRTAECMGVQHIFCVGYTPTPDDPGVQKTAMGTDDHVSWSSHHKIEEVLAELTNQNVPVVALETAHNSKPLTTFQFSQSVALLVGNERFGLSESVLRLASDVVEVPMRGRKNSLNVANALAITTFAVVNQWSR